MSKLSCDYIFSAFLSVEVFVLFSVVLTGLFVFLYIKGAKRSRVGDYGLLFLLGGAFGNLVERLKFGCVRDYINFFNLFHFNIQDLLVTAGIMLIIWTLWKAK
jgi:signal peptidase II